MGWLLYGIKPVVIAIIIQALWSLGSKAIKGWLAGITTAAVLLLYFLGFNEIALLFGGGLIVMLALNCQRLAHARAWRPSYCRQRRWHPAWRRR